MPRVLFSAPAADWPRYRASLLRAAEAEGLALDLTDRPDRLEAVEYLVYAPGGPVADFTPFTGLKAVLSLWAGVERILGTPGLTAPLCRMVDEGLTRGMVEWVTGHVLRYHLGLDTHITRQDGVWRHALVPPLAKHRPVGVLGLGALGTAVAKALTGLGFPVAGWSRRPRELAGVATHSGEAGLAAVLRQAQILVALLPATPATENLLDAGSLALLPPEARLINPGRGTLVDDAALLAALDTGRLAHVTLDVFRTEPLPPDHPFWVHPRVTVTPHIASATRPETAAEAVIRNIRRAEDGLPLLHRVDPAQGY